MDEDGLAVVANGLADPTRIKIINLLKENGNSAYLSDLVKEILSNGNQYKSGFASVRGHVIALQLAGIVKISKQNGFYFVQLLKDVQIQVKNVV